MNIKERVEIENEKAMRFVEFMAKWGRTHPDEWPEDLDILGGQKFERLLDSLRYLIITRMLQRYKNINKTAELMGKGRNEMYRWLNRLGIDLYEWGVKYREPRRDKKKGT